MTTDTCVVEGCEKAVRPPAHDAQTGLCFQCYNKYILWGHHQTYMGKFLEAYLEQRNNN